MQDKIGWLCDKPGILKCHLYPSPKILQFLTYYPRHLPPLTMHDWGEGAITAAIKTSAYNIDAVIWSSFGGNHHGCQPTDTAWYSVVDLASVLSKWPQNPSVETPRPVVLIVLRFIEAHRQVCLQASWWEVLSLSAIDHASHLAYRFNSSTTY